LEKPEFLHVRIVAESGSHKADKQFLFRRIKDSEVNEMSGAGIFLVLVLGIPIICIILQKVLRKKNKNSVGKDS
jgi:hypothetical protein